jgi:pimeloyl-ACP methyl ester carboxylesterase
MPGRRVAVAALGVWLAVATGCGIVDDDAAPPSDPPGSTSLPAGSRPPATTAPTTEATSTTPPPAPEPEPVRWAPCPEGDGTVECGQLVVPLDHDDPGGATIELALARRPAEDPDARLGVLAVNPGGPGGSGVELLLGGFGVGGEVDERFDLVSWDPRGVGASTAVTCGGEPLDTWLTADPSPDDAGELDTLEAAADALADHCGDEDGELLAHVGTEATVEDLDLIRAALGEEQLSYLGLSYGTLIGLLYLEAHPDRVRTMVLDGVMDPAAALPDHARAQAGGFEAALVAMAESCADERCPVPDVLAAYDQVAAAVEEAPIPAGPYPPLGPAQLAIAAAAALYDPGSWSYLADGLADAQAGDGSLLASLADSYFSSASFTAYTAVVCSDFGPPDRAGFDRLAAELGDEFRRFGPSLAYELLPCAYWPAAPVRTPRPLRVPDDAPPILLVGATGDPATPLSHARAAAAQAPSRLLEVEMDGHVALGSDPCATDWIVRHLVDGTLPDEGETC